MYLPRELDLLHGLGRGVRGFLLGAWVWQLMYSVDWSGALIARVEQRGPVFVSWRMGIDMGGAEGSGVFLSANGSGVFLSANGFDM